METTFLSTILNMLLLAPPVVTPIVLSETVKVCLGTNIRGTERNYWDSLTNECLTDYRARYENCTHVLGNLEIFGIRQWDSSQGNSGLSFLRHIKEVTGYVFISNVVWNKVTFESLRIIRGQSLFRLHPHESEHAVLVVESEIVSLEFPVLTEITKGNVAIYSMTQICSLERLNWNEIMLENGSKFQYVVPYFGWIAGKFVDGFANYSSMSCEECNHSCQGGCWGGGPAKCQTMTKLNCNSKCGEQMCFGDGKNECCHSLCAGGCNGPKSSDCVSCKGVYFGGKCHSRCPSGQLSVAGAFCSSSCPGRTLMNEGKECLAFCPEDKQAKGGVCKTVAPPDKKCRALSDMFPEVEADNIAHFQNCTIFDGDIRIELSTFEGGQTQRYNYTKYSRPMDSEELNVLSSLQQVQGRIEIEGMTSQISPSIVTYFRSIEVIERRTFPCSYYWSIPYTLKVYNTSLSHLDFRKLRKIGGQVGIYNNENLCYVKSVNWSAITDQFAYVNGNNPEQQCRKEGRVCSEQCARNQCWGPNVEGCLCVGACGQDVSVLPWNTIVPVIIGVGITFIVVGIVLGIRFFKRKLSQEKDEDTIDVPQSPEERHEHSLQPNLSRLRLIRESKLRRDQVMGSGFFGTVYKGVWLPQKGVKILVALKVLNGECGPEETKQFVDEAYLMAGMEHAHLLSLVGLCVASTKITLVTQLMPLGSLQRYLIENKDKLGSKAMLTWCTQIAQGMEYLERSRLVHRDLATRNVLLETPLSIRITDFGLAKMLSANECDFKGEQELLPIKWLAIECLQSLTFSHKSDVWAFGVAVWEILTYGEAPFNDISYEKLTDAIQEGQRLEQPMNCSLDLYKELITMWLADPEARPTFQQLVFKFTDMRKNPSYYICIPGDELMRLPMYTPEDELQLIRRLASKQDRPEEMLSVDNYYRRLGSRCQINNFEEHAILDENDEAARARLSHLLLNKDEDLLNEPEEKGSENIELVEIGGNSYVDLTRNKLGKS